MQTLLIIDPRLADFLKERLPELYPQSFGKLELKTISDMDPNEKFDFFFVSARELCENEKMESTIKKFGRKEPLIFACSSEVLYTQQVLNENKAHHSFVKEDLLMFHNSNYERRIKKAIEHHSNN